MQQKKKEQEMDYNLTALAKGKSVVCAAFFRTFDTLKVSRMQTNVNPYWFLFSCRGTTC